MTDVKQTTRYVCKKQLPQMCLSQVFIDIPAVPERVVFVEVSEIDTVEEVLRKSIDKVISAGIKIPKSDTRFYNLRAANGFGKIAEDASELEKDESFREQLVFPFMVILSLDKQQIAAEQKSDFEKHCELQRQIYCELNSKRAESEQRLSQKRQEQEIRSLRKCQEMVALHIQHRNQISSREAPTAPGREALLAESRRKKESRLKEELREKEQHLQLIKEQVTELRSLTDTEELSRIELVKSEHFLFDEIELRHRKRTFHWKRSSWKKSHLNNIAVNIKTAIEESRRRADCKETVKATRRENKNKERTALTEAFNSLRYPSYETELSLDNMI